MSVQSEIDTLRSNIAAMNAAIEAAGGTASSTGMDGAAASIETIPQGGGDDPVTDWGTIYLYPYTMEWTAIDLTYCSATVEDSEKWEQWLTDHPDINPRYGVPFMLQEWNNKWAVGEMGMGETYNDAAEVRAATGVYIYDITNIYASFSVRNVATVDTTGTLTPITIASQSAYNNLGTSSNNININGTSTPVKAVARFVFGTLPTSVPNSFLSNADNLSYISALPSSVTSVGNYFLYEATNFDNEVDLGGGVTSIGTYFLSTIPGFNSKITGLDNVVSIGSDFLSNASFKDGTFNQPLNGLEKVSTIGANFLSGCIYFNQPINIPSCTTISSGFLDSCSSFNQSIIMPSTLTSVGTNIMSGCTQMVSTIFCQAPASVFSGSSSNAFSTVSTSSPCYATGISLSGTYATDWKANFPDRDTSPYRKIVLV